MEGVEGMEGGSGKRVKGGSEGVKGGSEGWDEG